MHRYPNRFKVLLTLQALLVQEGLLLLLVAGVSANARLDINVLTPFAEAPWSAWLVWQYVRRYQLIGPGRWRYGFLLPAAPSSSLS
jgi:hypothetical protein